MREVNVNIDPLSVKEKEKRESRKNEQDRIVKQLPFWRFYMAILCLANAVLIAASFAAYYAMYAAPVVLFAAFPAYFAWVRASKVKFHESWKTYFEDVPVFVLAFTCIAVAYMVVNTIVNAYGLRDGYGIVEDGVYYLKRAKSMFPISKEDYTILQMMVSRIICGIPVLFAPWPACYFESAAKGLKRKMH